jgi:hypothetical protein
MASATKATFALLEAPIVAVCTLPIRPAPSIPNLIISLSKTREKL